MPNAVDLLKDRLADIERELAPLLDERNQLTAGIAAMEAAAPSAPARRRTKRTRGSRSNGGRRTRPRASSRRAPRGANRDKILAVLSNVPMTARDVEQATGIPSATAATTLNQMRRSGLARKAPRGYVSSHVRAG